MIGSILSNLCKRPIEAISTPLTQVLVVLVLGMCFFAGGVKFSEQGFGVSACPEHACLAPLDIFVDSPQAPCS